MAAGSRGVGAFSQAAHQRPPIAGQEVSRSTGDRSPGRRHESLNCGLTKEESSDSLADLALEEEGAPEEIVDLAEVLSDHKEIDVAKHTIAGMLELQRQANNGVWEAKFSSMIEPISEMAFMPSPAEVCNTLKLLEGSRDILWNTLMEVRRKQIVLDSMIVARQSENKEINSYAAAGDLSQAASTDTPTPLPTAKSSAGELTAHEDENQFSEAISNKTKAMYTMRQRQVYDLQVQNSLKVTESHIFSTIISDEEWSL